MRVFELKEGTSFLNELLWEDRISMADIINITDAIQGIFDYV